MSQFIYPWKRFWVQKGEIPSMESGLFLDPVENTNKWYTSPSNGEQLISLKDVPCLVLLGDVGMGKSTTTKDEAERLREVLKGEKHEVVYEDLKRLSEALIERRIFQHPLVEGWSRGEHALTL